MTAQIISPIQYNDLCNDRSVHDHCWQSTETIVAIHVDHENTKVRVHKSLLTHNFPWDDLVFCGARVAQVLPTEP